MKHKPICVTAELAFIGSTALGELVHKHTFEGNLVVKRLLTTLLTWLVATNVWAEIYSYNGANYTSITNHTTSALGSVGNYLNTMKITGTLTTAGPLAANLGGANITAQVTSYSFSDGLTTFSSADSSTRLLQHFVASTNASGQITGLDMAIGRWQTGAAPHALSDRPDYLMLNGASAIGVHNVRCSVIGVSLAGAADSCFTPNSDSNTSEASAVAGGVWSGPIVGGGGSVAAVPTLSEWGVFALASLMAMFGIAHTRRRQG